MDELTTTTGIVAVAGAAVAVIALLAVLVMARRLSRLRADQRVVFGDREARDLVAHAAGLDHDFRALHSYVEDLSAGLQARLGTVEERLDGAVTHHGLVCANAGVDQSNASGEGDEIVLLPEDPDASAASLRAGIEAARGAKPAVVIADSFGRAWRLGQTDVALGAAGLTPLDQWIGRPDAFGRTLHVTSIAVADSVAAAADLARAKDSLEPVVLVRGLERFVTDEDGPGAAALRRPAEQDLFR